MSEEGSTRPYSFMRISFMKKYAAVLVCCGIVYSYKTPFTKRRSISGIQSNTKFWLSPIIFYSSGCPKMVDPTPMKVNWTQFLVLQFDREELGSRKAQFSGRHWWNKMHVSYTSVLSRQVWSKSPKESFFGIESLVQSCWHLWLWWWVKKSQFITYPTVSGEQHTWQNLEPLPYELVQVMWFPLW